MKLIDRFISRELIVKPCSALASSSSNISCKLANPLPKATSAFAIADIIGKFSERKHIED
jgi:hypothetical protein